MDYRKFYKNHFNIEFDCKMDIHHIDGDRSNNNIDNLLLLPKDVHNRFHNLKCVFDIIKNSFEDLFTSLMIVNEFKCAAECNNMMLLMSDISFWYDIKYQNEVLIRDSVGTGHYNPVHYQQAINNYYHKNNIVCKQEIYK